MKQHHPQHDDSLESDAVWQLLDQAAPRAASPSFVANTVRIARLEGQARAKWWLRWWAPAPLAGLAVGVAAVAVISFLALDSPRQTGAGANVAVTPPDAFEDIQLLAEEETLTAALEYPEDLSDSELVYLIGM